MYSTHMCILNIYIYIYVFLYINIYIYIYIPHICIPYTHIFPYIYTHIYVYSIYIHIYIYIYSIYIYIIMLACGAEFSHVLTHPEKRPNVSLNSCSCQTFKAFKLSFKLSSPRSSTNRIVVHICGSDSKLSSFQSFQAFKPPRYGTTILFVEAIPQIGLRSIYIYTCVYSTHMYFIYTHIYICSIYTHIYIYKLYVYSIYTHIYIYIYIYVATWARGRFEAWRRGVLEVEKVQAQEVSVL